MSEVEIEKRTSNHSSVPKSSARPVESQSVAIAGPVRTSRQIDRALSEFDEEALPPVPSHPQIIDVLMKNAKVLFENGEARLAVNILRNVLMREPGHIEALRQMGICQRNSGAMDEALKCFRALTKSVSGRAQVQAQMLIAETLYLMERDQSALDEYRQILELAPTDELQLFEVYKNVGNIHVRCGDFESAEEFYNKAYSAHPNSDVLMVNYGTLEIQRENLSAAVERFRRGVEINPENDKAWVGLAIVHRQMGDFELAWANLERALDINRANRTAIRLLAEWGALAGQFWAVIPRLQEYLEIEGEDAEMSFVLAKVFTQIGHLHDARLEMERVLALDPAMEGAESLKTVLDRELARQRTVQT